MSISNAVGARVAGCSQASPAVSRDRTMQTLTMHGQSGIVYVIDGIRRTSADFNGLDPNEIESVSILKIPLA
ncbi:TonB-dependent receptor plug domain-containing protein [Bacteroides faecis]|nr:TonB-dependent receptor plug domain-containing protein [Bacteroides faecis]